MTTIPQNNLNDLLENLVKTMIQEKLELIMKEEMNQFLQVEEQPEIRNSRNGYYERTLDTRYGKIEELKVPRDRKGNFQTQLFEPYQRRDGWLEEAVIHMYKGGMSTRDVARFIEGMFGTQYSPTTISNITSTVLEDVERWHERPLEKRYSVIYLDGFYFNLKRDTVDSEVVYLVMGINEQGYRNILGFYIGGKESANGWREVLGDLKRRGATEVLLGVFDGLIGLEDAFKEAYPKADVQHCVVHKVRNVFPKIRVKDKTEFLNDLKTIYNAPDVEVAKACFDSVKAKWGKQYPKEIESWETNLPTLLTFYKYPVMIKKAIYTSNPIERTNKEFRKRLRPMNSLTNIEAAEKIIYLDTIAHNERWGNRIVQGFNDPETREALLLLFETRYPSLPNLGGNEEPEHALN